MAMRNATLLLVFGLIIGSFAVAQASRGLLNDDYECKAQEYYPRGSYYPPEKQRECPKEKGDLEDCFHPYYYDGKSVKVVYDKKCLDHYDGKKFTVSYTDNYNAYQCYDGSDYKNYFIAKCDTKVKYYIVDDMYFNKKGYEVEYNQCLKDPYNSYNYYPKCKICNYKPFEFECKKENEYYEYENKGKN